MTIGKLPATGPSPSPTQKNQEAPDNNRAGFQQAKPASDRVPPKPFQPKSGASPKPSPAPSGRTGAPDAPPAGTGGSAKTFWAQQDAASARSRLRDRRKAVRRQARPRLMRRRPRPSRLRSASRPRRHRNPPTRPPAAPGGQELLEPAKTQSVGKPTPSTQQPAPSIGKPAPAPSKPTGRSAPRPQNESAPVPYPRPGNNPRRIPD